MDKDLILRKITDFYLRSRDFNGIPITDLGENFEEIRKVLKLLLEESKIVLNFGDRHPNPHILAFEPELREEQIEKLNKLKFEAPIYEQYGPLKMQTNFINCCAYPSKIHLASIVRKDHYRNKPYTLSLALGKPQLSYRAFNLKILESYRNDPRYSYETNDISGSISAKKEGELEKPDEIFLQTFGFAYDKEIKNRYVAVFLRYLADLTPEHQQRWKLEEFDGATFLHPDYARTTAGDWPEKESIFTAFQKELYVINRMAAAMGRPPLFREDFGEYGENKPRKLSFLVRPTLIEFNSFVQLFDKLLSDNINKNFFRNEVPLQSETSRKDGKIQVENKGTLQMLDDWVRRYFRTADWEPWNAGIAASREVRKLRQKPAHALDEDVFDQTYFEKQRELITRAYSAIRTLRLLLANHPAVRAAGVEVPDWLQKGEIWTY
jgi:hypothetical protein